MEILPFRPMNCLVLNDMIDKHYNLINETKVLQIITKWRKQ